MKKICQNNKGLTLVELIVSVALLGIFFVCCAVLIRPCAEAFTKIQQQTRAQHIADTIVEDLRSELLNATGTIRFTDSAQNAAGWKVPFEKPTGAYPQSGSALEICPTDSYYELIDAGYVPETVKIKTDGSQETLVETSMPGFLHMRYYALEQPVGGTLCYKWKTEDGKGLAYAYADAYTEKFYMKDKVRLKFEIQGCENGYGVLKITAVKVSVYIYGEDAVDINDNSAVPVHTQIAILELPNKPVLVSEAAAFKPQVP